MNFDANLNDCMMKLNGGISVGFNMTHKLAARYNSQGEEIGLGLPPYGPRTPFLVDEYPACPKNWMRSEGKASSYFIAVKKDMGMWLDFNKLETPYHVAALVSVQGVNAVTGMEVKDVHLEQYIDKCPKHDKPFGPQRLCTECGYKWPKQNYVATTGTPHGLFWLDGFRAADGAVRQYILTEDKVKGVAANIIGDKRVFAVGVSFFLAKEGKRSMPVVTRSVVDYSPVNIGHLISQTKKEKTKGIDPAWTYAGTAHTLEATPTTLYSAKTTSTDNADFSKLFDENNFVEFSGKFENDDGAGRGLVEMFNCSAVVEDCDMTEDMVDHSPAMPDVRLYDKLPYAPMTRREVSVQKMEIGAGARINQSVYDDPENLDYWRGEPEAVLYINYVLEEDAVKIIKEGGKIDLSGSREGFLAGIPQAHV